MLSNSVFQIIPHWHNSNTHLIVPCNAYCIPFTAYRGITSDPLYRTSSPCWRPLASPSRHGVGECGPFVQFVELLVTAGRLVGRRLLSDHGEVGGRRVVGALMRVVVVTPRPRRQAAADRRRRRSGHRQRRRPARADRSLSRLTGNTTPGVNSRKSDCSVHRQKRYLLKNVGVAIKFPCSFYPCNGHRRSVKFLENWGCTYNPTLH